MLINLNDGIPSYIPKAVAVDTEFWEDEITRKIDPQAITMASESDTYFLTLRDREHKVGFTHTKCILEDESIPKYFHNAKADLKVLWQLGIDVKPLSFDTIIASYLIDPRFGKHGLKDLTKKYFNYDMINLKAWFDEGKTWKQYYDLDNEKGITYAVEDALYTYKLTQKFKPVMDKRHTELYYKIELPLAPLLAKMEMKGINIDRDKLSILKDSYIIEVDDLERQVRAIANPILGVA